MRCERSCILALIRCWERRIGCRLDGLLGQFDPQGVDVVLSSSSDWSADASTDFMVAANYNKFDVTTQRRIAGSTPASDSMVEDIESNYPKFRFVATANTHFNDKWNVLVRASYYGSHWDERGTQGGKPPSFEIGATIYFDVELGYQVTEEFKVTAGASNIFDSYVDTVFDAFANRNSVGLPYPRRSAANYEGGSWYLKASYRF